MIKFDWYGIAERECDRCKKIKKVYVGDEKSLCYDCLIDLGYEEEIEQGILVK